MKTYISIFLSDEFLDEWADEYNYFGMMPEEFLNKAVFQVNLNVIEAENEKEARDKYFSFLFTEVINTQKKLPLLKQLSDCEYWYDESEYIAAFGETDGKTIWENVRKKNCEITETNARHLLSLLSPDTEKIAWLHIYGDMLRVVEVKKPIC